MGNMELQYIDPLGSWIKPKEVIKYKFIAANCGDQPTTTGSPSQRARIEGWFPLLIRCEWSITASSTPVYNCIAFSAGLTDRWVEQTIYVPGMGYVNELWIDGVHYVSIDKMYGDGDDIFEMNDLDSFYATVAGLTPTATDQTDAIVMYYNGYHAARKKGCNCGLGKWIMYESKCGRWERIEHVYNQLDNSSVDANYGTRSRYYK